MNIIADNSVNKELIGGEAWHGMICDQLAENYVKPDSRYEMIQLLDGFVQEGLAYKPLDRSVVRTKELMLEDGQEYHQHYDPFLMSARKLWADIQANNSTVGNQVNDAGMDGLRVSIPNSISGI